MRAAHLDNVPGDTKNIIKTLKTLMEKLSFCGCEKNHEKLDRVSILVPKTVYFFASFWCPFRALNRFGAKLVPEPPPRAPGMVPDSIFNVFWMFLDGLLVAFCVRPLVCHHVFCNCFWIPFWLIFEFPHLSATTKIKSTVAG